MKSKRPTLEMTTFIPPRRIEIQLIQMFIYITQIDEKYVAASKYIEAWCWILSAKKNVFVFRDDGLSKSNSNTRTRLGKRGFFWEKNVIRVNLGDWNIVWWITNLEIAMWGQAVKFTIVMRYLDRKLWQWSIHIQTSLNRS